MNIYTFYRDSGRLTLDEVKAIISGAGYAASNFTYSDLGDNAFLVQGDGVMARSTLLRAAKDILKIRNLEVSCSAGSEGQPAAVERTAANPLGATNYGIKIAMSQATVAALSAGNYSLYGFKAVQTSVGGGAPLVWFQSNSFGLVTTVDWDVQYEAYTSRSQIVPNGLITGLSSYEIDLGQQLSIDTPQGTGSVGAGNTPLGIEIHNETTTPVTCGISEVVGGTAEPLCAFPLYGKGLDAIVPIQKVMLTFATKQVNTGTVIEKAYSESLLVDLTSANQRAVSYDINTGWEWGGYAWAQTIMANSKVGPLLIEDNSSFAAGAQTMLG